MLSPEERYRISPEGLKNIPGSICRKSQIKVNATKEVALPKKDLTEIKMDKEVIKQSEIFPAKALTKAVTQTPITIPVEDSKQNSVETISVSPSSPEILKKSNVLEDVQSVSKNFISMKLKIQCTIAKLSFITKKINGFGLYAFKCIKDIIS